MAVLHNRISQKELKQLLFEEKDPRVTISFYRYFTIADPQLFRDSLYKTLQEIKVFGRIYVATEGINAQVSVPEQNLTALQQRLEATEGLQQLRLNIAVDDGKSFWVLKIKVREKIVADGIEDESFDVNKKGQYLDAAEMNTLCQDPETIILDMRNHYEYEVGHFTGAVEISSDTFREQLPMAVEMMKEHKDKNIVMYCTGGIRCEKASAYMLHHGFSKVRHLEGGIINYAKQIKELGIESRFVGKNFVFDNRLGERITEDIIAQCHQCGQPCDVHTNCKNDGCHLLFIQCENCSNTYHGCCSTGCAEVYLLPEEEQKEMRKGMDKGQHIFNKAKARLRPKKEDIRKNMAD